MNMKLLKVKADSRSGVTLVELLVVMLIVTILAVALLPLMQKFVVKAKYAAEPIPVIGNLRTMIGVYKFEDKNSTLPGLRKTTSGEVDASLAMLSTDCVGGESYIMTGSTADSGQALQTFVNTNSTAGVGQYAPTVCSGMGSSGQPLAYSNMTVVASADMNDHFARKIDVNYADLTGNNSRPNHYQYRVLSGGYNSGAYAYAVGVFGDGNGLDSGTGYAVIEIVNPSVGLKFVGTWSRYRAVRTEVGQIGMWTTQELVGKVTPEGGDWKKANVCFLGNNTKTGYMSSTKTQVEDAITELKNAGWE